MLLLLISFIAGILTVLAPCILPLLPVIIGGSFTGENINKKKTLTIITSLAVSVIVFTLLLKVSTLFIDIPPYTWTVISGCIIVLLGVVTVFPQLWEGKFMQKLSLRSNKLLNTGDQKNSFIGDVIVGASLGPVFSTCSPTYFIVLATVLPVQPLVGLIYIFAYVIGLSISLLIVTIVGQKLIARLGIVVDPRGMFKRGLGVLFIFVGVAILTGFDKKIQTELLSRGFFDVTKIEQLLLEKNTETEGLHLETGEKYPLAPELSTIDGYINTDGTPVTLASLRGKVVLLDIWTYSCINCQRTIPYLNDWYAKYKDKGFVIIGLHTPEFAFEKVQSNVEQAVKKFGIQYPVLMDNDYSTWKALDNQYWPRKYLIDKEGRIIYDHIGEGAYAETEREIQKALDIQGMGVVQKKIASDPKNSNSPETYFGSARNQNLANGTRLTSGPQMFTPADMEDLVRNKLYLTGTWNITDEYAENTDVAEIIFPYDAQHVYITAGSDAVQGVEVSIYQDEVFVKNITITEEDLYTLIENKKTEQHVLRLKIPKAKLKVFTFTFG